MTNSARTSAVRGATACTRRSHRVAISQVIEGCRGGDPEADVDCTLVLLRDRRFRIHDTPPPPRDTDDPTYLSGRAKVLLAGTLIATPLVVGIKACELDGCEAVFGTVLGIDLAVMRLATFGLRERLQLAARRRADSWSGGCTVSGGRTPLSDRSRALA